MAKDGINQGQTQLSQSLPITKKWQDLSLTGLLYINIVSLLVGCTVLQPIYHSALHCIYPIDDCSYLFAGRFHHQVPRGISEDTGLGQGHTKNAP